MKTILVPVDFSEVTHRIVGAAKELAAALDGHVVLLHVAPPDPDFVGYEPGPPSVREHLAEQFHEEHTRLQALKQGLDLPEERVTALLVQGPTAEKILEEEERLEAGLIVMGSHGHGALYHLLAGSVTDGVLRGANCPVLVVPAQIPDSERSNP